MMNVARLKMGSEILITVAAGGRMVLAVMKGVFPWVGTNGSNFECV